MTTATIPSHVPTALVSDFNHFSIPGADVDPYAAWKKLHSGPDIFFSPNYGGFWVATRAADMKYIMENPQIFSSTVMAIPNSKSERTFDLPPVEFDPPLHTDYQKLLAPAFSPKNIGRLADKSRALTTTLLDGFIARGECEFITEFAHKMPIGIFMGLIDLPDEDAPYLASLVEAFVRCGDEDEQRQAHRKMMEYLAKMLKERRDNPGEGMLGRLITADFQGRKLTDDELMGYCILLLSGGLDTVASTLGFVFRFLAENPDYKRQLMDDPALISAAVNELLRRFSVTTVARQVIQDVELNGVQMKKGDMVLLPLNLWSLDDRLFDHPMDVDFHRENAGKGGTFGAGPHRCIGSFLARTEIKVAIEEWLARIPDFKIKPGATVHATTGTVNGILNLPLVWTVKEA